MEHFSGRLEPHVPWTQNRDVSHLLRGFVDVEEANALLASNGFGSLRLLDNGTAHRRTELLRDDLPALRTYHLLPATVSKANGVAAHARARDYAREEIVAVGDSREDLHIAEAVGAFWLVANAPDAHRDLPANVQVTEDSYGAGVYEAVVRTLTARTA
jgi:hydroxymethylpyrimidine pyrophosphatase-like HAD family hydrolase